MRDTRVADFALGSDGTPWVALAQPQQAVCFWREGQWHKLPGPFYIDRYTALFHISPAGQVILSQPAMGYRMGNRPANPYLAPLFRLEQGQAKRVTDYDQGSNPNSRPLFFDSKGRIWNWGDMFLAKFEDGQWQRVEAKVGSKPLVVEDAHGNVYFFGKTLCYYREGHFTVNAELPPFPWDRPNLKCCLWGTDKALFIACTQPGVVVVDLNALTVSNVLHSEPPSKDALRQLYDRRQPGEEDPLQNLPVLVRSRLFDLFRDTRGDVWILALDQNPRASYYIKVCAADNRVEERRETAAIDWGDSMGSEYRPVLCTREGTVYFGTRRDGVYLDRDGVLSHISWQQGVAINGANWVYEHPDGTIWFASPRTGIAVYDPCGVQDTGPTSPFQASWEKYPLAAALMVRDFRGNLWCCLKREPGKVSRWDGQAWEHFNLGLDTASAGVLWIDNLQRIHVSGFRDRGVLPCRLTGSQVDRFVDNREMLVDSIRTGSREFRGHSFGLQAISTPLVIGDQEVWFCDNMSSGLMRYTAGSWHEIRIDPFHRSIFKHKDHQVLIGSDSGFTTLDSGELIQFTNEQTYKGEYLLGESGLQPFDKVLYETHPTEFFPARNTQDGIIVFNDLADFYGFKQDPIPARAGKLSKYLDRIWVAHGGFWAHEDNMCELKRYYQGLLLGVDLAVTPIAAEFEAHRCDAYEDANEDLWIRRGQTLFRVKRPKLETRIVSPQTTECASSPLRVKFATTSGDLTGESLAFAWRLDGGPWSAPSEQEFVDLEFPRSGPHQFEVLSIGQMGHIDTTPAVMKLNVVLPVPEVRIVSASQDVVTDLDVAMAYEIVKRSGGAQVTFQWRLNGGPWHDTREMSVQMPLLADGEHLFEIRAVGDGKYIQEPPASARLTVKVDYEKAIGAAIKGLHSADYEQREAAARRLVSLGRRCVPNLKKDLETAEQDSRWWIQAVLSEIENR